MTLTKLLTATEAAELLGVRPATIYTWASRRQIPFLRVRGALRFAPDALAAWVADQTVAALADPDESYSNDDAGSPRRHPSAMRWPPKT